MSYTHKENNDLLKVRLEQYGRTFLDEHKIDVFDHSSKSAYNPVISADVIREVLGKAPQNSLEFISIPDIAHFEWCVLNGKDNK